MRLNFLVVAVALVAAAGVRAAELAVLSPIADAAMYSENGGLGNGGGQFIFAGKNSLGNFRRSVLKFDIAGQIPAGSDIVAVSLQLTAGSTQGTNNPATLYPLTEDWLEGTTDAPTSEGNGAAAAAGDTTWTSRNFNTMAWTTAGGTFNNAVADTINVSGSGAYTWPSSASLTGTVQGWLDAPASNFGWLLAGDETTPGSTAKQFHSRTGATPPALTVTYLLASYSPVLAVAVDAPVSALVDQVITYTITLTADTLTGDGSDASGIVVSGSLGGAAAYGSGDVNANAILEAGETWVYTAAYTVLASDPDLLVNAVNVSFEDERGDPHTASGSASTTVEHIEVSQDGPGTVNATERDDVTLAVSATGGHGSFDYAWTFDNGAKAPVPVGGNSPSLMLSDIGLEDAGTYVCTVSDVAESIPSPPFSVSVAVLTPVAGPLGLAALAVVLALGRARRAGPGSPPARG